MDDSSSQRLSQRYNQINLIHQQRVLSLQASFQDALSCIAQIFVRHQAHVHFAITLLHRHHDLPPGCAMVHSHGDLNEDSCSMERLGTRGIFPYAYHCCLEGEINFLPYEFSATPVPAPDKAFLAEVAAYLRQHSLCEAIAISYTADPQQVWIETMSRDHQGTTAVVVSKAQLPWHEDYTVTEWAVIQDDVGIRITAIKGCNDKEVGHKT